MNIKRKHFYMDYLNKNKMASWKELSKIVGVSELTVRRDMKLLEKKNIVTIASGGVELVSPFLDTVLKLRTKLNITSKTIVAKKAAKIVKDKDVIFIDAGSTTEIMLSYIKAKSVTIITNGLNIAIASLKYGFKTIFISGEIKSKTLASVGKNINEQLNQLSFSKAFIGANGASIKHGYSTPDFKEAEIKTIVIKKAKEAFILMDESKFGLETLVSFAKLNEVQLITSKTPTKYKKEVK